MHYVLFSQTAVLEKLVPFYNAGMSYTPQGHSILSQQEASILKQEISYYISDISSYCF